MAMGTLYNTDDKRIDKIMLPSRVLEAVEYLAAQNGRSRVMEIRQRIMSDEEVKEAVKRIAALKEEIGPFPDIDE